MKEEEEEEGKKKGGEGFYRSDYSQGKVDRDSLSRNGYHCQQVPGYNSPTI